MNIKQCPGCKAFLNADTCINDEDYYPPSPGDFSICFQCGTMVEFGSNLEYKLLTEEKQIELLKSDPETLELLIRTRDEIIFNKITNENNN